MSKNIRIESDPVAIVGMSCRFPGGVDSPDHFWKVLENGVDTITDIPHDRWDVDAVYDSDRAANGKTYVRRGGFIDGIGDFDPSFFGISPREAVHIDPQQRLLLEVTQEALEDAGEIPRDLSGKPVGVFVGYYIHDYAHIQLFDRNLINVHTGTGTAMSIGANRISYLFNFQGPSMALDTACSSSLVAVHLACQSILSGESDLALAGGVNAILRPEMTIAMSKASMLAPDGQCKSFDEKADGFVRSEGAGLVLLKRLSAAQRDGNPIHAIIRSSAVNQDGRTNGISVPSGDAQQKLIWEAYERAGITPSEIQYVEAHGTGTPVGDPIEANALGAVLSVGRPDNKPCLIGSVKTNIGHTESASGVAGLIKTVLSLKNRQIPANLHFDKPNPKIRFDENKLRVPTQLEPWPDTAGVRLASLNSFGFGGTNAHLVIQEAPTTTTTNINNQPQDTEDHNTTHILPLSAQSPEALTAMAQVYRHYLDSCHPSLQDIVYTAAVRRSHHPERLALTVHNKLEAVELLDAFLLNEKRAGITSGSVSSAGIPNLVFVFTGMGPQWWAMGRQLFEQEPVYRAVVEECDALLSQYTDWSLLAELSADEAASRINEAFIAQPAIFALQAGLFTLWQSWGVEPAAVVGHSIGEVAASYAAGILSLADAIKVVYHRSRLQYKATGSGKMLAVELSEAEARDLLSGQEKLVAIAAINSPKSVTFAGDAIVLEAIQKQLEDKNVFARFLQVEIPYHSPAMEPLKEELHESLAGIQPKSARIPFYSTALAEKLSGDELTVDYWWKNIRDLVNFQAAIDQLITTGHDTFLEIGAHPALSRSLIECLGQRKGTVMASLRRKQKEEMVLNERALMLNSLGKLYTAGYPVDWRNIYRQGQVISLPTYPWQREHYWSETKESEQRRRGLQHYSLQAESGTKHPLLGYQLSLVNPIWNAQIEPMPYMQDHRVRGAVVYPGAAYLEMAMVSTSSVLENEVCILDDINFHQVLFLPNTSPVNLQTTLQDSHFNIYSKPEDASGWTHHASGKSRKCKQEQKDIQSLQEICDRCPEELTRNYFYPLFEDIGLDYGLTFQGIEKVWRGSGEVLAQIKTPEVLVSELELYIFHPAVLDACLHTLFCTMFLDGQDSDMRGDVYLPVSIHQFRLYRRPSQQVWSQAVLIERSKGISFTGNIHIYDADGNLVAEALGLHCQNLNISSKAIPDKLNNWLYEYQWQEQSKQEISPSGIDSRNLWLILADRKGFGTELVSILKQSGQRSILVYPDQTFERISDTSFNVNPQSAEDIKRIFQDGFDLNDCAGLVHLWSLETPACENLSIEELKTQQVVGYGSALHLLHAHLAIPWQTPPRIWLVTSGTQSITGNEKLLLAQAPIWGLSRVMGNENPETHCSVVDLSSDITPVELNLLAQELLQNGAEDEVALRGKKRFVHRFSRLPVQEVPAEISASGVPYELEIGRVGSLDTLQLRQGHESDPKSSEVLIQVHTVGMNFKDLMKATGLLPESVMRNNFWGRNLGMECSGTIIEVGEDVNNFRIGDSVIAFARHSFCSSVITDQRFVVLKPHGISFESAATIPLAFLTAYYSMYYLGRIQQGDRVLIHAATGGVGQAAIQIAKWAGAEIFATAGSPEKREFLKRQGIKYVMDSRSLNFADEIIEITQGAGVDLVLNSLVGEAMEKSLSVLGDYGRFLELGKLDIDKNSNIGLKPFDRNISFSGVDLDRLLAQKPELVGALFQDLLSLFTDGHLQPLPQQNFDITQIQEAFRYMASAKHIGKIVVSLQQEIPVAITKQITFDPQGTYLVTGGLGGFGLSLVQWLVDNGARHLVLVSRSGASSAVAVNSVAKLREKGVTVLVSKADVSDEQHLIKVFAEIKSLPPLKGVFHAAAILDDGLLKDQNLERYFNVMGSKLLGAWILHTLTKDMQLDHFVLYSSVTSVLGNQGSGNYVAANCFVDSLAYYRRQMGLPALTVNWGVVADVGMAARETHIRHHLERNGLVALYSADGLKLLGKLLQEKATQVTVAPINWPQWFKFHETGKTPRFSLMNREGDESSSLGATLSEKNVFLAAIAEAQPEERRQLAEVQLRERVARVLGMSPAKLDTYATFTALGLDSLMALEMRLQLEGLGIVVSVSKLLEGSTVNSLIDQVLEEYESVGETSKRSLLGEWGDDTSESRWFFFPKVNPQATLRLFCFPYAGAAPTVYYQWPEGLPDNMEICAINLPGRSRRIQESALDSITENAKAIIADFLPLLDKPFAFFGHCMGSILMYEVVNLLQERYNKKPIHLFLSASMAPHLYQSPLVHELADPKFMEVLQLLDFTNTKALLNDEEMRELMLPTLRADFEAVANYSRDFSSSKVLDIPMTAFAGKQDIFTPPNAMLEWRKYTTSSFQFWMIDIHHYFVETHQPLLLKVISHTLSKHILPENTTALIISPDEAENIDYESVQQEEKKSSSFVDNLPASHNPWLNFIAPNPSATKRIFCFPPAFGSDLSPEIMAKELPENVEVCSIEIPGRGKQMEEIPWTNIYDIVDALAPILASYLDKPFAFFGHCMGGIIMYELACKLEQKYNVLPSHFFCSGIASPDLYFLPNVYLLDDQKIIEILQVINYPFADELDKDLTFRRKWMQTIRADFEVMNSYRPSKQRKVLDMPITSFKGRSDLWIAFYGVDSWKHYTTNSFELITHFGDHFFIQNNPSIVVEAVTSKL
jgi:acyl transferase domain-containing protein/surfactin synthase thioesterase subunit/acyl carrier protein